MTKIANDPRYEMLCKMVMWLGQCSMFERCV